MRFQSVASVLFIGIAVVHAAPADFETFDASDLAAAGIQVEPTTFEVSNVEARDAEDEIEVISLEARGTDEVDSYADWTAVDVEARDIESAEDVDIEARDVESDEGEVENILQARGLTVSVGRKPPGQEVCPASNNGPANNYPAHTYTNAQLTSAMRTAATLQANKKQIGVNKYPHKFGNKEKLEFSCGANKMEFPMQFDGKAYNGGATTQLPDRLVYEYTEKKGKLTIKFCGVMRHGPVGGKFIKCHK